MLSSLVKVYVGSINFFIDRFPVLVYSHAPIVPVTEQQSIIVHQRPEIAHVCFVNHPIVIVDDSLSVIYLHDSAVFKSSYNLIHCQDSSYTNTKYVLSKKSIEKHTY